MAKGARIERLMIDQATAQTAAWVIGPADSSAQVESVGSRLRSPAGGINVLNGREGTDVFEVLHGIVLPLLLIMATAGFFRSTLMAHALQGSLVAVLVVIAWTRLWVNKSHQKLGRSFYEVFE